MISGEWITAFVVAVITAFGTAMAAYRKGQANPAPSRDVTLKEPVPEVPFKRVYSPPSFSQHMDLARRVGELEIDVKTMRREQGEQFRRLLEVGEERKDKIFEKIDNMARGFHARVDQIMDDRKSKNRNNA